MRSLLTCIAIVVLCVCLWRFAAAAAALEQFLELFGRTIELLAKAKGHGGAFGVWQLLLFAQLLLASASLAAMLLALRLALRVEWEKVGKAG